MLMTSMRGNARRVSYGARTMVYLLAGILFLFAFAACDPVMDDMDKKDAPPITGGSGNDTLTGTDASEAFEATAGSDTITSFSLATGNSDTIDFSGFTGDNAVDIGELSFALSTGDDTDDLVITGYGDGNMLTLSNAFADGGAFYANGAALSLNAAISLLTAATTGPLTSLEAASGQGTATGDTLTAGEAGAHLFGFEGDDVLTAHADGSILFAGNGNDRLIGVAGTNEFYGGNGIDTVDHSAATTAVTVDLSSTSSTLFSIENIIGGSAGDTLTGTSENNDIRGGGGNDTLNGGGGNDTLAGGTGNDMINGDTGTGDIALYAMSAMPFTITGGSGSYTVATGTETDTLTGVETIQLSGMDDTVGVLSEALAMSSIIIDGGEGADTITLADGGGTFDLSTYANFETITGGTGADTITGGAGAETINGGMGNDTITGGAGTDTLNGGGGNDTFIGIENGETIDGGAGSDTVDFASASRFAVNISDTAATNQVEMPANSARLLDNDGSEIASFTLRNVENITSSSSDTTVFVGNDENNVFDGGSGSGYFSGNGGNDIFIAEPNTLGDTFLDFSNVDGNNDKIDFRKNFSGKRITDLGFRQISLKLDLAIDHPGGFASSGATVLRNAFAAGGVLAGYMYTTDAQLATDFHNSSNGIDSSKFFIFTGDPGD